MTLGGSFGLFFTLFLLFCRYLPMVAIAEVKPLALLGEPTATTENDHERRHKQTSAKPGPAPVARLTREYDTPPH